MHKTIYIDIDEEITSILDKIRDEESTEICIVVPKNAALTQGIINLKLLKKEVTKYGKTLLIATNDPQARKVIKRLEIKTQEIAEADLKNNRASKIAKTNENEAILKNIKEDDEIVAEKKNIENTEDNLEETKEVTKIEKEEFVTSEIGSESFFDGVAPASIMEEEKGDDEGENEFSEGLDEKNFISPSELRSELYSKKKTVVEGEIAKGDFIGTKFSPLREMPNPVPKNEIDEGVVSVEKAAMMGRQAKTVRKMSTPEKDVAKNLAIPTLATTAIPKGGKTVVSRPVDFGLNQEIKKRNVGRSNGSQNFDFDIQKKSSQGEDFKVTEELNLKDFDEERSRKAEEFFGIEKRATKEVVREMEKEVKKVEKQIVNHGERERGFFSRWGFVMFILILFIGVGGFVAWGYTNYPQAEIVIYPHKKDFDKEIKVVVKEGADTSGFEQGIIPGQYKEMTIKKTMKFNATGETYASDDGKAKGKVTIYNNYSTEEQSLVATTRILSKEGKLFRLAKSTTVPGMEGEKAGTVEVAVIADQPGEEFNLGSTTFTIEGFKGNPKYTKFEVKSFEPMEDGGSPDSNKKLAMISADDITRAREKTIIALDKGLEEEVKAQLGGEMSAMFDSVDKEIVNTSSTNEVNDIAQSFSYTVEQKIKLVAFTTTDVNSVALLKAKEDVDEDYEIEESQSKITFKKSITDFENKTMTMYLDATSVAWPKIDTNQIAESIAKKKEEEIKTVLLGYPSIEKIELLIKPSWLTRLPISKDKIAVKVIK